MKCTLFMSFMLTAGISTTLHAQTVYNDLLVIESTRRFPFTGKLELEQNYPNPLARTESTVIKYRIADVDHASLVLYNSSNQIVRIIPISGNYGTVKFNGQELAPGTYVYALLVNGRLSERKKMMVVN